MMLKGCLIVVSKEFSMVFQVVFGKFQGFSKGYFKNVPSMSQWCIKGLSRVFYDLFFSNSLPWSRQVIVGLITHI